MMWCQRLLKGRRWSKKMVLRDLRLDLDNDPDSTRFVEKV